MNSRCPRRSRRLLWLSLFGLTLALLFGGGLGVSAALADDPGGIEIGPDPSVPRPPRPPRPPAVPDTAGAPSAVPAPPPGAYDSELDRARERMAHEQSKIEEERDRAQEELERAQDQLDRAQQQVNRHREIRKRGSEGEHGQHGEIVRMGQDVVIEPGDIVSEVVVIGGDLEVQGEVDGDAVAVGGDVQIGPGARVSGDAVSVGGDLQVSPGAIVDGDQVEVGTGVGFLRGIGMNGFHHDEPHHGGHVGRSLLMLLVFLFVGWLAAVLAGERLGVLATTLAQDWLRALLTGVLVLVLWLPAVFLSAITVIGIPVAIVLILAVPLLIFVGYLIGALALGRRISVGLGRPAGTPLRSLLYGILVIGLLAFIGRVLGLVGFLGPFGIAFRIVSYALFSFAATSGLGVIALAIFAARFRSRTPGVAMPPPPPPAPPASPESGPEAPPAPTGEPTEVPAI
jgi:hypothetical protein